MFVLERFCTFRGLATGIFLVSFVSVLLKIAGRRPKGPQFDRIAASLRVVARDFSQWRFYVPWKSATPTVFITSKKHIAEYSEVTCLSQQAVYADMFGFKHTMDNLEHDRLDHKVVRNKFNNRLLEVKGPGHLRALYPKFVDRFENSWDKALKKGRTVDGWVTLPTSQTCRQVSTRMISLVFFGEKLTSDEKFIQSLLQYSRDMVNCMIAFQILPGFLSRYMHHIITRGGAAMRSLTRQFTGLLGPERMSWNEAENVKECTIIHNMAELSEGSNYWTGPAMNAQNMLGIWFAASHQPWMNLNFILLELCARPEWQARLRAELFEQVPLDDYVTLDSLPLLDSFMKEVVRLNPLDHCGIRRKAVLPYRFADQSISVPQGATVCVPAYNILHDPSRYPEPHSFDGERFARQGGENGSKFTHVSHDFPMWGYGSLACPGRFHAALVIKVVISQLLMRYELRLEKENARRKWMWETFAMPFESTKFQIRPLDEK